MSKKPIKLSAKERVENFSNSTQATSNVVACRMCGSTNIDQKSRFLVRCYGCNAEAYFDGVTLAVIPKGDLSEAKKSFQRDEASIVEDSSTWQRSLGGALGELLTVTESVMTLDGQPTFHTEDFKRFMECWERCRPIIERECRRVKKLP